MKIHTGTRAPRAWIPNRLPKQSCRSLVIAAITVGLLAPEVRADYASTVLSHGPLGYWRFDETSSSPALNQVANSSTLGSVVNGNVVMDADKGQPGILGSCVRLRNTGNNIAYCGSKIDVPYHPAINPAPPFSIEFWAKAASLGADSTGFCPVSSMNPHFNSVNRSGWLFYLNNSGRWQFGLGGENYYMATLNANSGFASTNVWQHIVGTYNGTTIKLYANGVLVGNATLSAAANAAFKQNTQFALRIGGTPLSGSLSDNPAISAGGVSGNRGFDGWVDEVAVYASELGAATIAAHFEAASTNSAGYGTQILAANPVGYWNLDEPAVTAPTPDSLPVTVNSGTLGNAANGTNLWGVLAAQPGAAYAGFGAGNKSCLFNGDGGYVSLANPAGLNISNTITLMAWIKPTVKDHFRDIIAHGWDAGHAETFLRISRGGANGGYGDGNYYEVGVSDGGSYYDAAYFPIPDGDLGNWVFLAGTYDGSNWNLYRNGVLASSVSSIHGAKAIASRWSIASRSNPSAAAGAHFGGYMDEPAVFATALSAADIHTIYNAAQVPPVITRAPELPAGAACVGSSLTLSVWAEGSPNLDYQWTLNSVPLAGETGTNLTLNSLLVSSNGTYAVVVTNSFGSVTSSVSLAVVSSPPFIISQPASVTNCETWPATLSVIAAGNLPLSYQWQKETVDVPGATDSSLTIGSLAFTDAGNYSVVVSNSVGSTNSAVATLTVVPALIVPDADVQLMEVPDYNWYAGCFGTATGNLMGYWDRHGLPDFYTGPSAGGVAPLDNCGNNIGIRSMWASKAGLDGRPANLPGHVDDYWATYNISLASCGANDTYSYGSTLSDPYKLAGRTEHAPDCIGDFIGLNQKQWTNMNNECDGNIDAYSFVYWDTNGSRRVNFVPPPQGTNSGRDIPSGLRAWTRFRGYDAEVFSQLVSFNPNCPPGQGFTFADLRAEIDAGYPVLVFLQRYDQLSRSLSGMPKANPEIHGMLVYGYMAYAGSGTNVYCRTSWGSGDNITYNWSAPPWVNSTLSVRGVIGFHPKPKIRSISLEGPDVTIRWDGPSSQITDLFSGYTTPVHRYQLERSPTLSPLDFQPVGAPTTDMSITVPDCCSGTVFYRVQLLSP